MPTGTPHPDPKDRVHDNGRASARSLRTSLTHAWSTFSNLGVDPDWSIGRTGRAMASNWLVGFSLMLLVCYLFLGTLVPDYHGWPIQIISAALQLGALWQFSRKGKHDSSILVFLTCTVVDITMVAASSTPTDTLHFYLIPVALAGTILLERFWISVVIFLAVSALFITLHFHGPEGNPYVLEPDMLAILTSLDLAGILLTSFFFFWVARSIEQSSEERLDLQNRHISEQYVQLKEQYAAISASLRFAQRIQTSMMSPSRDLSHTFIDRFVFAQPRDMVGGDFHWIFEPGDGRILFAVGDCSGHGIPGAFLTVVCMTALTEAARTPGLASPGAILDRTDELVLTLLGASQNEINDGMDIALCSLTPMPTPTGTGPTPEYRLDYAGANMRALVYRRTNARAEAANDPTGNALAAPPITFEPNKQPIGRHPIKAPFQVHSTVVRPNDMVYMTSDGYYDQFGGHAGKKMKAARVNQLLADIQQLDPRAQKKHLATFFDEWKGDTFQVDDVCVVGVRIKQGHARSARVDRG